MPEYILARLKREIFSKPGWRVAVFERIDVSENDGAREITCVGALDHVQEGEDCRLRGQWQQHPRFGAQFKVLEADSTLPRDAEGVAGFLRGLSNIGPKRAEAIVGHFGPDQVFAVIEKEPQRLTEISGVTPRMIADISESYGLIQHKRYAIVAMKKVGMTDWQIAKVFEFTKKALLYEYRQRNKNFGAVSEAEQQQALREHIETALSFDPYRYLKIKGFGFIAVDRIALAAGVERQGIPRSRAGILYVLSEAAKQGHCFVPGNEVSGMLHKLVGIKGPNVKEAADALKTEGLVVTQPLDGSQDVAVFHHRLEAAESQAGNFFSTRVVDVELVEELRRKIETTLGPGEPPRGALNREQQLAVGLAVHPDVKMLVITGGPGTGKTHLVRELVRRCESGGATVGLCSPTGKGAKRLAEQTDRDASTVHRMLEWSPIDECWRRHEGNPLPYDVVVLDEASMLDVELCALFTNAVAPDTKLIFVGDVNQLPSIGPGNVLRDCIDSHRFATVRLTRIYRQSEQSYIAENAKRMNQGLEPTIDPNAEDFFWHPTQDAEGCFGEALRLVCDVIPDRHGVDPIADVQVLCPQRKGVIGIYAFNDELQQRLNPGRGIRPLEVRSPKGGVFRAGDKVRHIKNNYDLAVMNGESGIIASIEEAWDEKGKAIKRAHVDYGDRTVVYPSEGALVEVVLNYGSTIHASQGSEYPIVVLLCHSYNYHMLSRNLIYTGLTRAKQAVYIVGDEKGLRRAIKNTNVAQRYTQLAHRIRQSRSD